MAFVERDGAVLRRIECEAALGSRYALECSLVYKATWIRVRRCRSLGATGARVD